MNKSDFFAEFGKYPVGLAGRVGDGYFLIEVADADGARRKLGINMGGAAVGESGDDFISSETYRRMLRGLRESDLRKFKKPGREWEPISRFALDELARRHKSMHDKSASQAKAAVSRAMTRASGMTR